MAKIVTVTNPLTGQPAQVDQLDHTAQQVDDAAKRALEYGLGSAPGIVLRTLEEVDAAKKIGWYSFYGYNGVSYCDILGTIGGTIFVTTTRLGYEQFFFPQSYGYIARRIMGYNETTWGVWEYFNPPMELGGIDSNGNPINEYRTTERYNGKPVYIMTLNAGSLPAATIKSVDLATTARIFECKGFINTNSQMTIPARNINGGSEYIDVYGEYNHIKIVTSADRSSWSAIVTAKYTKTTD